MLMCPVHDGFDESFSFFPFKEAIPMTLVY